MQGDYSGKIPPDKSLPIALRILLSWEVIKMGVKLIWTGVVLKLLLVDLVSIPSLGVVCAVISGIGLILMWLDK